MLVSAKHSCPRFPQLGRLIDEDRKAREAALRAEAEKIYEYGQQEDEKRRKAKNNWGMVREKKTKAVEAESDKPVAYDEVFAKIQAATGITHVEELVAAFVSAEDHNFSMFNYVNELNQEAEKLEEQTAELQQEIQRHTGAGASENSFRKRLVQVRPACSLQPPRSYGCLLVCAADALCAGSGGEGCGHGSALRGP